MKIGVVVGAVVAVVGGFGIGCIPFVQEHLHWNIWFIVPVSGLVLGMLLGLVQFFVCFLLGTRVSPAIAGVFSACALLAYLATELGTYETLRIDASEIEGAPDGEYRLSSLVSFQDYLSARLGSQTLVAHQVGSSLEVGETGAKVNFVLDLLGAALGAFGAVLVLIDKYTYCAACGVYEKRSRLYRIRPAGDDATIAEVMRTIAEISASRDHQRLVRHLAQLEQVHQANGGHVQIDADERACPRCSGATVLGRVMRRDGSDWKEVTALAFSTSTRA